MHIVSTEERRRILSDEIAKHAAEGWFCTYEGHDRAVVLYQHKPSSASFAGDLGLTIITLGFYIPVWVIKSILRWDRSKTISVDAGGNVTTKTTLIPK